MNLEFKNEPQSAVYPGNYVPAASKVTDKTKDFPLAFLKPRFHSWKIIEGMELFTLEVNLPDVQKQDLLIHVENAGREISLIYKMYEPKNRPAGKLQPAFALREMHIPMPSNADLSFVRAQFLDEKLIVVIPKGFAFLSNSITEVFIY